MQDVIISIQPKWCKKIAKHQKPLEIRKKKPKLTVPFKCFIYCTKARKPRIMDCVSVYWDDDLAIIHTPYGVEIGNPYGSLGKDDELLNGKIIGEFICDNIMEFESEFWDDDDTYESIAEVWYDEDGERNVYIFTDSTDENFQFNGLCKESNVPIDDLKKYVGLGIKTFYGWHISDLKIYDKPRELSEFNLKRPPQSWCYVKGE